MKSRLVIAIISGRVLDQMSFFRRNSNPLQLLSAPAQEGNLPFYSARSARKKLHHFPFKLSHLILKADSRPVWLSSSACEHPLRAPIPTSLHLKLETFTAWQLILTRLVQGRALDRVVFDLFVLNSVRVCPQQDEICLYKYTKPDCNANFNCQ